MNEEKLYRLAISDVSTYSLLNEILAIRDNRSPNEEVDYCINVNGYISLDALNKYVEVIEKKQQTENERTHLLVILQKAMNTGRLDGDDTKYIMDLHEELGKAIYE